MQITQLADDTNEPSTTHSSPRRAHYEQQVHEVCVRNSHRRGHDFHVIRSPSFLPANRRSTADRGSHTTCGESDLTASSGCATCSATTTTARGRGTAGACESDSPGTATVDLPDSKTATATTALRSVPRLQPLRCTRTDDNFVGSVWPLGCGNWGDTEAFIAKGRSSCILMAIRARRSRVL